MSETTIETTRDLASLGIEMEPKLNKKWQQGQIIDHVSSVTGISVEDIKSTKRQREIVEARYICMYLIKENMPNLSFRTVGLMFGRDHSTVMHAIVTVKDLIESKNNLFCRLLKKVRETV